ncbi:MAG: phosphopyruvate hydratase, partial [Patescibacteria group bacterium]|nr:phosphopyruvate hydratase [Patescibacteria group bacterium]
MKIDDIQLRIISDSRGKDTLEAILKSGNLESSASVPSGKSIGATEAAVMEPQKAVENFPSLASHLTSGNVDFSSLEQFDKFLLDLDGTSNKANLGGNVLLALSMAFTRLLAKQEGLGRSFFS